VVEIEGIDYESTFGGVIFSASQAQSGEFPTDFAEETIVGGAVSGTSYTYRDWFSNPPDTLDLPILLPDRATLEALAALRAYPVDTGGVTYELHTAQFSWQATLDKLTWSGAYLDTPVQARATFTKVQDLGLTAPTGPTTVTAGYVAGPDGLNLDIDLNFGPGPGGSGGTTSSDGQIDDYWIEWGDGTPSDHVTGGPWAIGSIPIASHTYAAPSADPSEYVVEITTYRNSVPSEPYATVVPIA
jgi:hypothetical protein